MGFEKEVAHKMFGYRLQFDKDKMTFGKPKIKEIAGTK